MLGLVQGASGAKPLRGVGSGELSCLLLAPTPAEAVGHRGFLHRVYGRTKSQHAYTMHIKYDAHLPFLQQACESDSFDIEEDPCLWK